MQVQLLHVAHSDLKNTKKTKCYFQPILYKQIDDTADPEKFLKKHVSLSHEKHVKGCYKVIKTVISVQASFITH